MQLPFTPFALPHFLTAAIVALLVPYLWRHRAAPGAPALLVVIVAAAEWSVGTGLELLGADLPTQLLWLKLQYLGTLVVTPAWLAFVLRYTGRGHWLAGRYRLLLAALPAATLIVVWTNDWHGWMWSRIGLDVSGPYPELVLGHGSWYWVWNAYAFLASAVATVWLLVELARRPGLFGRQVALVLISALLPCAVDLAYVAGLSPFGDLYLTPIAFSFSGIALLVGLFRYRLLEIAPVARRAIVDAMGEGVIVLDTHGHIVDVNPAAVRLTGLSAAALIGQQAAVVFPELAGLLAIGEDATGAPVARTVLWTAPGTRNVTPHHHELRVSPLTDARGGRIGQMVLIHDVTDRTSAEAALRDALDALEDRVQTRTQDLQQQITERLRVEDALRQSEAKYRLLAENATDVIWTLDLGLRFTYASPSVMTMRGYTPEEVLQQHLADAVPPGDLQRAMQLVSEQLPRQLDPATRDPNLVVTFEMENTCKDGSTVPVEARMRLLCNAAGEPVGILGVSRDISERKRAEAALRQRAEHIADLSRLAVQCAAAGPDEDIYALIAEQLRLVTDALAVSTSTYDAKTQELVVRHVTVAGGLLATANRMLGHNAVGMRMPVNPDMYRRMTSEVTTVSNDLSEMSFGAIPRPAAAAIQKALGVGLITGLVLTYGSELQGTATVIGRKGQPPLPADLAETVAHLLAVSLRRKRTEEALRESEERYRHIFENSPIGIYQTTPDGQILTANPALVRMLGYSSFEDLAKRDLESDGYAEQSVRRRFKQLIERDGQVTGFESVWLRQDGVPIHIRENAHAVRDNLGRIIGYEGTVEDITAYVQAEEERRRLGAAMDQAAESVMITDTDALLVYVNPAFERLSGYSRAEVLGKNPRLLKSGGHVIAFYQDLWATISSGQVWRGRMTNRRRDGSTYAVDTTITPVRDGNGRIVNYAGLQRDITRELQLEEQYRQAQKMEAVGLLAGGVAHDFNNMLTVINGYAELLRRRAVAGSSEREMLDQIMTSGQRAADLVRQLLAFSRKQMIEPRVLDLNRVVADMEKMLRRLIGEHIRVTTSLAPDLWPVKVDPAQIQQVVMNLAVNARDAMPHGGTLRIETTNVVLDESYVREHVDAQAGDHVRLTISDTGTGMTPEVQAHIFEPFFTTKELGKGTGLGLATVYGIVRQSGGDISVTSQPGRGTTFRIYLPRASETGRPLAAPNQPASEPVLCQATVLVVEDEPTVRSLATETLGAAGYAVLAAPDGQAAWHVVEAYPGRIDLLLTDIVMPGMNGPDLATRLRQARPGLKVLFMSGYADGMIARRDVIEPGVPFISKPFLPDDLERAVRDVLSTDV